jgi:uncharacterized protein YbbK (DUF523 family)
VGISRCLLGEKVRYDGSDERNGIVTDSLSGLIDWLPVCPEVDAGMSVPREPVRIVEIRSNLHMTGDESGRDWTSEMDSFCSERIEALSSIRLHGFVLKSRSPSCGLSVPLISEEGEVIGETPGFFARHLTERFPDLPVIEESDLEIPERKTRWLKRVTAAARVPVLLLITIHLYGCQQGLNHSDLKERFRNDADAIIEAVAVEGRQLSKLAALCEETGSRLAGSEGDLASRAWAESTMTADGLENVRQEMVSVPHWERGVEEAELVNPASRPLKIAALGFSVATRPGGLEADVVALSSFEELEGITSSLIEGKIVLFNYPMERTDRSMAGYADAVRYRTGGPAAAAGKGAVACLIRSVGTGSTGNLHTGITSYVDGVPQIPAAALTMADADDIEQMYRGGMAPRVRIVLGARSFPDAEGANVIGEIRGREKPDEIVVIGGHLDSWDLSHGAHDDGAGCVQALEAARILLHLGLRPRRTIRVVLFAAEEVGGLSGGRGYQQAHLTELDRHVAAIESDSGAGPLFGFSADRTTTEGYETLREILRLLEATGASELRAPGGGGADIGPLAEQGVPVLGVWPDVSHYFDYHHSEDDVIANVIPDYLADGTAALAVMAYILAEMETPLPRTN